MQSKIERESQQKRKPSTFVTSNSIVAKVLANTQRILRRIGIIYKQSMDKANREIKKSVSEEECLNKKVRKLTMQGDFTGLLIEEEQSVIWQSIARKVP